MVDKRVTLTIKLRPGKDDDLIEWWNCLEKGDYQTDGRQSVVKAALRYALGYEQSSPETSVNEPVDYEDLKRELYEQIRQELMGDIEQRLNTPFVPPAPPSVESVNQIDQQTAIERKRRLSGANW